MRPDVRPNNMRRRVHLPARILSEMTLTRHPPDPVQRSAAVRFLSWRSAIPLPLPTCVLFDERNVLLMMMRHGSFFYILCFSKV